MSEKQEAIQNAIRAINQALTLIDIAAQAVGREIGGREVSLAKTNTQQARHWLIDASTELDIVEIGTALNDEDEHADLDNKMTPEERQAECDIIHPGQSHEEFHRQRHDQTREEDKDSLPIPYSDESEEDMQRRVRRTSTKSP